VSDPPRGPIVDRLRANLREAGIPLAEADLDRILELDLLRFVVAFEDVARATPADQVPEHTGDALGSPMIDAEAAASPTAPQAGSVLAGHEQASANSILGVARLIRSREVSPVDLTEHALRGIAERDRELNAFQLVLADRAREAARHAEREIAAGRWLGPLHGVPVAIKDLLDVEGTPTSAGSQVRDPRPAASDATSVARLRAAGAVIVGKTRLAEFAYSPGSNNSTFGPTRNPHDPTRDTGGSSSGSGAAVAAGIVFAALGSDTGGSIRIPAAQCGIVGLKPTCGRVSLDGAVPLSWSLDHVGPMTRTVADAALVLRAIAGADPGDPRTRPMPVPEYADAAALAAGVRGLRIGVVEDDGGGEPLASDEGMKAWRDGLARLATAGAELVPIALPMLAQLRTINGPILAIEAATYHAPMMRSRLAEYGEFARLRLIAAHGYGPRAYVVAQQARGIHRRALAERIAGLHLFSTPTMPGPAPPLGVPASTRHTAGINVLGWPAISVPVGPPADGMPLGIQLVGRPWDEATVLRAGRVVEGAMSASS
jgi:aspartyl-tRNA(Asn)/glutamyl-tRNA(Gln) amidotransferase subunit A